MNGRIESYIHSDSITPHKGGALVTVTCDTDFGAKTPEFVQFAKQTARWAYASQASDWSGICEAFPEAEVQRLDITKVLREKIIVRSVAVSML